MQKQKNTGTKLSEYPLHVVILSGGAGSRLWPLSSGQMTKPFLQLPYDVPLITQAVARAKHLVPKANVWIVTTKELTEQTLRSLPDFPSVQVIQEPTGKNTAAACMLAAVEIEKRLARPVTLVTLPADHYIPDVEKFSSTMLKGANRASQGESLVTFGLKVDSPKTEYGYIEAVVSKGKSDYYAVKRFIEKPPLAKAKAFAKSKKHFWNSGIFCWRSDFFMSQMKKYAAKVAQPFFNHADIEEAYRHVLATSIDYALLEKSSTVETVPSSFAWSDLGTWASVAKALQKKSDDNVFQSSGKAVDGKRNFVRSGSTSYILFGVSDLVIVEANGTVLVTTKEKSADLKKLINQL